MLILTRKAGQSIIIGGKDKITVASVKPGRVKLYMPGSSCPVDSKEGEILYLSRWGAKITIRHAEGGQVSLGVDAPRAVSVHREEIQARVDAEFAK